MRPEKPRLTDSSFRRPFSSFILHPSSFFCFLLVFAFGCSSFSPSSAPVPPTLSAAAQADNPTAGAIARGTRQAQATRNSRATATRQAALATQTAAAAALATQTAGAQAAATATVAARATGQAVLAAKSAWPQRLLESFADNQLGWPIGLTQDHSLAVTSTVAAGRYQWLVKVVNGNSYFNLVPAQGPVLTDFDARVALQFVQGNDDSQSAYGLAFRHVGDDYGFFGILKSGGYRILEVHHSGIYQSIQSDSSAIDTGPGATNRIEVAAIGSDFVFLINDQLVGQMAADFSAGKIGLGVDTLASAPEAQVDFSTLEIYAP
jgi:hypothetical protein